MSAPPVPDAGYHDAAERLLLTIERQADDWLEQGVIDIDTHRAGGLLELSFPNGSKIVVNKQPPLQEIWLAARQGGFHFRRAEPAGTWHDTRDGQEFFARLSEASSAQAGKPLTWGAVSSRS